MATGYTHPIADGTLTELRPFALACARQFGALVMMRDAPADAPIPERFKPSDYHVKAGAEEETRLAALRSMSQADIERACAEANQKAIENYRAALEEGRQTRARYEAMLAKVRAWTPPTPDHVGLREFMESQIVESIRWDCHESAAPVPQIPGDWHAAALDHAERMVAYHAKEHEDEIRRAAERTAWIAALRASLA